MKRSHEETDVYVGRRPGPPTGLTGSHPPPGMPVHNPGFQHPVLAPPPGQLAHSFEQMRDNIPRPPFSSPHLSASSPHLSASSPHLSGTSPHLSATSPHLSATSPHLSAASPHLSAASPHLSAASPHLSSTSPHLSGASSHLSAATPHLSAASPHLSAAPIPNPQQPVAPSHPPAKPAYQTHVTTPNSSHATAAGQQQYQRLKVEDALSYLDQVKLQFGNQPQVYNEFLDIMKEFKSQSIDTPGVISRVSALFKGHPDLIVGFNTFLPPGYKIEVSLTDINTVNVCAPTGTTTHVISGNGLIAAPPPPPPQSQNKVSSAHSASTTVSISSSVPLITTTVAPLPKSPTRPSSLPPKSSSPLVQPTPALSLGSPGISTLQKPRGEEINDSCSPPQAQHHAINYVTKIKNRFQGQPEVYQKFLDILNNYQTEQKAIKENAVDQYGRPLQEQDVFKREGKLASEVYQQVAKLFNKQEDLLQEFSQFLPDATGSSFNANAASLSSTVAIDTKYPNLTKKATTPTTPKALPTKIKKTAPVSVPTTPNPIKTEPVESDSKDSIDKQNRKRHKSALKDVSLAEAIKHGNFSDFSFFEKVRKALKSPEVYENFLRCLVLFNHEVISRPELIQLASSFLGKFPDLFSWFKIFLGYKDNQQTETNISGFKDRGTGSELAHLEIDFASCKRSGASYRALPKSYVQPKCSGRTQLCKEVLNDTWVSLPSWSEDTQFPGTRKTQYEEYIYKCEDERFELDIVIETNLQCIRILDELQKKMTRMSVEEQQKFRIEGTLGASSDVVYRNAINRIYGDKAAEVIDGLKKTPYVATPLILKRLRLKDEEWRHGQKQFNKIWRDQNEKYYLKSLDHQGINFKQHDLKAIRSKTLIREIEQIFEERSDQIEDGNAEISGPHLTFSYQDQSSLEDASSLIIHHMKRQTGFHKEEKSSIKVILLQFLQELFFAPPGELSDDEQEMEHGMNEKTDRVSGADPNHNADDIYNLIFVNNTWYILLRLHQMLSVRLLKMYKLAMKIADNEAQDKKYRREGTAEALRLKKPSTTDVEDYYPLFLDMVKNLLDGQIEPNAFEDTIREIFGVNAYISFTMDKLIQNIVRQLHNLVTDDASMKIIDYYKEEKENNATGGLAVTASARSAAELAYQKKAENLLVDDDCFKLYFHRDKGLTKMSMELLPSEDDHAEDQVEAEKWSEYVEKYVGNTDILPELKEHLCKKPIFLLRNASLLQKRLAKYEPQDKGGGEEKEFKENDNGDSETTEDKTVSYPDVYMDNKLECKILLNSYKLRYVSGTSDFMYRRNSLAKAKQTHPHINTKLHNLYESIHSTWLTENTTQEQCSDAEGWFMGSPSVEDIVPCTTHKNTIKVTGLDVNKYSVTYSKESKPGTQAPVKHGIS